MKSVFFRLTLALVTVLLITGVGYVGWILMVDNGGSINPPSGDGNSAVGEEKIVKGVVIENSFGPCRDDGEYDRPCIEDAGYYLLLGVNGKQIKIVFHYGYGEPPCQNSEASRRGEQTRRGENIEVFGKIMSDDGGFTISTCDSPDYYILRSNDG